MYSCRSRRRWRALQTKWWWSGILLYSTSKEFSRFAVTTIQLFNSNSNSATCLHLYQIIHQFLTLFPSSTAGARRYSYPITHKLLLDSLTQNCTLYFKFKYLQHTKQQMDDTNSRDDTVDVGSDADNIDDIEDEDSDNEEDENKYSLITLDKKVLQRLKQNDPSIKSIRICLQDGECFFNTINWKNEYGDCIAKNTQLKKIYIYYHGRDFYEEKYILGELGNNLPSREQLHAFFLCVYRNSSIEELSFGSIQFVDGFGGRVIEGLQGHPSLLTLEISQIGFGRLRSIGCEALGKVLKHSKSKLADLRLMSCQLNDEEIGIVCDGLVGNGRMKKLSLQGNKDITSVGWRALSTVIRHPNCKLIALDLHDTRAYCR